MKKLLLALAIAAIAAGYYLYDKLTGYREVEFCIAVTNDIGRVPGLLPRAVTAIKEASRSCGGDIVIIDNGGLFAMTAADRIARREASLELPEAHFLAAGGYRFINLSPDVFLLGPQTVRRFLRSSGAAVLTDNLHGIGGGKRLEQNGLSLALYGLTAAPEAPLMPPALFDGMTFDNPFAGGSRPHDGEPADFSVLTLRADLADLSTRFGVEPSDVLLSLHTRFPHLSLVVMNDRFPAALVPDTAGGTRFIALDRKGAALSLTRVRMIKHDTGMRGVVVSLDTYPLALDKVAPDAPTRDVAAAFDRALNRAKERVIGTPWFTLELAASRKGDTVAARFLHETLLAAAAAAGKSAELSIALTPVSSYRHEPGTALTLGGIDALVPVDRHPVLATLSGSRLADLLQGAWERYPDMAASLFPLYYTVQPDGVFRFADGRFDPDRDYTVVMDGRIADLLAGGDEGGTLLRQVLPSTLGELFARGIPSKLSYQFSPLWKSE